MGKFCGWLASTHTLRYHAHNRTRGNGHLYQGPFKSVQDDDGHRFERGVRTAVCDKTFKLLQSGPYAEFFATIEPLAEIQPKDAKPFKCSGTTRRHPKETKGQDYSATTEASKCTDGAACC